jgi:hypothetical protein
MSENNISKNVILYKICKKCGEHKTIDLFRKNKNQCKSCKSIYDKNRRSLHKELIYKKQKQIRNTPENKERKRLYDIQYRAKNKDILNKQRLEKYHSDPNFKIRHLYRTRLNNALNYQYTKKVGSCIKFLGCSILEFKKHLESKFKEGMNWENHNQYGWHIDHIIPCINFNLTNPEEIKKCFHYTNLQPLWWYENLSKGDKVDNVDSLLNSGNIGTAAPIQHGYKTPTA